MLNYFVLVNAWRRKIGINYQFSDKDSSKYSAKDSATDSSKDSA